MAKLDQLRELLGIQSDQQRLTELDRRVDDPESRTRDVADVLPAAIADAERRGTLSEALSLPVERAIHRSVSRNPKDFADVLFPVMGPAIRRSITEALRGFVEGLNQAMEQRFSPQALGWRLEAWRSGVPYREVVLRHTLQFRVRLAFLIQRDSGLLIEHAGERQEGDIDEDAFSAMLTAIQDFITDSTGADEDTGLSSAVLGGQTVWVLSGYGARLAAVIDGHPPTSARERLTEILERMHADHGAFLQSFDGSQDCPAAVDELLTQCVLAETRKSEKTSGPGLWVLLALIGLGLAWMIWAGVQSYRTSQQAQALSSAFAAEPGLVLMSADFDDGIWYLKGLGDPVARSPAEVATTAGVSASSLDLAFAPYYAAEPPITAARLIRHLSPPDTVTVQVANSQVRVSGTADATWIGTMASFRAAQPDPSLVDVFGLTESDTSRLARLSQGLALPDTAELSLTGSKLVLSGEGDASWIERVSARLIDEFSDIELDASGFADARLAQFESIRSRLDAWFMQFEGGVQPAEQTAERIDEATSLLLDLFELAEGLDRGVSIEVMGYADATGQPALNRQLRQRRANWLIEQFARRGVPRDRLSAVEPIKVVTADALWRRAELRVRVDRDD